MNNGRDGDTFSQINCYIDEFDEENTRKKHNIHTHTHSVEKY